ncbi:hypothetical protein [Pseudorhodoferax sp. Leaf267]|uniref:hypothetical protein n=1 Tax=Pseudorhodoferax sp. Leaf267 TaxID=1736316 RepID=UPI0006F22F3C|nr:hypothetical protein [Pseudorhodoferax sp. Leaf267]KQP23622.1 hypothetical protein ASF43_03620 [Pseudorhodoferax sp. Leaf267]
MSAISLPRVHARRLREVYRSAGWPYQDPLELELLAGGLLERSCDGGRETVRLTETGIQAVAQSLAAGRRARSAHEDLVDLVARAMGREGRIVWRGLSLRALVPGQEPDAPRAWCMACPDVFSIRNTSVATYVEPVVHEVKVSRADLLGDLRKPAKRAAYLDLGGQCWYVLGNDARGRAIGDADDVPPECGVMALQAGSLAVLRNAPRREVAALPFHVWMSLARATPCAGADPEAQQVLQAL